MKKIFMKWAFFMLCMAVTMPAMAQFNVKALKGAAKAVKAVTLTDAQMAEYVKEYIDWMDTHNQVCADDNEYIIRLKKLTEGLTDVEGIPLNFKVYYVIDVNAFACADGSVRIFSSLMDIMTDDELLGVIGHEVGHVAHKDSKNGFRTALLTSALKDGISSQGGTAAKLSASICEAISAGVRGCLQSNSLISSFICWEESSGVSARWLRQTSHIPQLCSFFSPK